MDVNEFLDAFRKTGLVSMGIKLLAAIAILVVGMKLVDFLMKLVKKANKLGKVDAGVRSFIGSFMSIVLKITVAVTAISVLGVPMTSFVHSWVRRDSPSVLPCRADFPTSPEDLRYFSSSRSTSEILLRSTAKAALFRR